MSTPHGVPRAQPEFRGPGASVEDCLNAWESTEETLGSGLATADGGADLCCGQVVQNRTVVQWAPGDSYLRDPLPGSAGSSGLARLSRGPSGSVCRWGVRRWAQAELARAGQREWSVLSI